MKEVITKHNRQITHSQVRSESAYLQIKQLIFQFDYIEQLKIMEEFKTIINFSTKKKQENNSWIGSLSGKTKILGDIVSPIVEESDWEVLSN